MSLLQELKTQFVGKKVNDNVDQIKSIVEAKGLSLEVYDPIFNVNDLDFDMDRINLIQDGDGIIQDFKRG